VFASTVVGLLTRWYCATPAHPLCYLANNTSCSSLLDRKNLQEFRQNLKDRTSSVRYLELAGVEVPPLGQLSGCSCERWL
jgi:hypothetical protein